MVDQKPPEPPDYLVDLLQPTPTGVAKLIAAWDGLSTESQLHILTELKNVHVPAYLAEKVHTKALDSDNAYVRYLAAKEFFFRDDDSDEKKRLKRRIEQDTDPLVRYCLLESGSLWLEVDPDSFFALSHEARLAQVRRLEDSGRQIARLIAHAVDHQLRDGTVSETELFEILSDYVNKAEFKEHYNRDTLSYDGFGEYQAGKDIEALWRLVLKLPEGISHVLIKNLPPGAGLSPDIPDDVLNTMTNRQLATLFYRTDIGLPELRKKMFFEASNERDDVRCAAICCNFDLEYPEFQTILAKPDEEKVQDLRVLATMANDLSLCLFDAIHDALFNTEVGMFSWEDAEFARNVLKRKLATLQGWRRKEELRELGLYRLARQAVPWKETDQGYPPSGELSFLAEAIVQGDTWGTFMAFSNEWSCRSWQTKKLEKHLPDISELLEDDLEYDVQSDDDDLLEDAESTNHIEERLTEMLSTLTTKMGDAETYLPEAIGKLTSEINVWQRENIVKAVNALKVQVDRIEEQITESLSAPTPETNGGETYFAEVTSWQEKIIEAINALKMQIANLETSGRRQKLLSYLVIGLLVLLILIMT